MTNLSDVPAGGWTYEYKTTKLVLRRITAGKMPGRNITLTKDYYVGVFEVTERQWELVMGGPSYSAAVATLPVGSVSYGGIRGGNWPASNAVGPKSFMGKLRAKTGIGFDLPTEAQWEYACRAGSSGDWGLLADGTMGTIDQMGWYNDNCSLSHAVGTKTPNAWGLYDMHGNLSEWCLDWFSVVSGYSGTDPVGETTGDYRVIRGGDWESDDDECGSFDRSFFYHTWINDRVGLRVAAPGIDIAQKYEVTFNANGGEGTMSSQTFTHGVEQALSDNTFTREGYTFAGWATSADGTVAYAAGESISVTAPMILYAIWEQQAIDAPGTYIVVDLSGGTSAVNYPVTNLSGVPAVGWTYEYKTTKLVLRKIRAGKMPRTDVDITLTKDYYVGVFEVTQKQWELVMGDNPSYWDGNTLPVEQVSYKDIRGTSNGTYWPASNAVDATSFMGKLRAKTGIDFDLPTEAQWEYACRAGSSGDWGLLANGTIGTLDAMGWYNDNSSSKTHAVGQKKPNAWGLYDMHGNVSEWCLDWYGSEYSGTDPVGATTGYIRVLRGGSYYGSLCSSSLRGSYSPSSDDIDYGLRVAAPAVTDIAQTYEVTFNANGGEGTMSSQTFTHGVEQALSANTFTREGYTFAGWSTSADGAVVYAPGEIISVTTSMTLYAVWQQQAIDAPGTYIVLDLSGGTSAANYPVTKLSGVPVVGWTDEYKTTKLVLCKITADKMPRTDVDITLTKDYYVGVFEVTQKQWELVMGDNPSRFDGDTLPVEKVSYDDIRGTSNGSQWPASNAVDATSFMGKLRAKTGIDFDLPTEAQWEYACRAGSSGDWGLLADGTMGTLGAMGWYKDNSSSKTHTVGTKTPNAWGLYDMHGNVWEWCLDWYGDVYSGTDPVGATTGDGRVFRVGSWYSYGDRCRSSERGNNSPDFRDDIVGLRVAAPAGIDIGQTYEVTFNANGGEGTMPSQTFMHGVEQALSANAFTREGYTVVGWATSADGTIAYAAGQSIRVTAPMTLYAVWEQQAIDAPGTYIVVDLSGGTSAANYPVTNLSGVPAVGWTDEYKTTKLVLRKITAGKMPRTDVDITLTKDYYVGVFEITQKQWELVMGSNSSSFDGDTLPVEYVSYDDIRGTSNGSQWPASTAVEAFSFMGKLRAKTGIGFDLPTEAQWEYACRAGSSGDWGLLADGTMGTIDAMGWYSSNSGDKTHAVGTKTPNAWGLYDMHGNVWEWCKDWYSSSGYSGTDPVGATTGNNRVARGGSWNVYGYDCRSSNRRSNDPGNRNGRHGFRVAIGQIYSVTFNANGGEGTMSSQIFTHGEEQALFANAFTREGYTFAGWALSAGGEVAYVDGESVKNLTTEANGAVDLYAVWKFNTNNVNNCVQLWEGGPYWAQTNIGAEKPEDYGYYFWWGDTIGYKRENDKWVASDGSSSNFSFTSSNVPTYGKSNSTLQSEGWITSNGVLAPEHDAARAHWGSNWRMPTDSELQALVDNCTWTWTTTNGINGYIVSGKGDYSEASIFLPATGYGGDGYGTSLDFAGYGGYYWPSVPNSGDYYSSWDLYFHSSDHGMGSYYRYCGRPVRPVSDVH